MIVILSGLAAMTVWGAVAPRGQWRALAGWSRRDPYASEPGPVAVAIHRLVAIVGIIVLGFSAAAIHRNVQGPPPKVPASPSNAIEQMWGAPPPVVVNRVAQASSAPPAGLIAQPILRYQATDGAHRTPAYLFDLLPWKPTSAHPDDGYIGVDPPIGMSALDTADLVVQLRGDKNCIPRVVVAVESDSTVALAVYYGRPNPSAGDAAVDLADCRPVVPDADSVSVLLPVRLGSPIAQRTVVGLNGARIAVAPTLAR